MKSVYIAFFLLILICQAAHATHLRGGEILAKHVSGQTYTITARLYLDPAGLPNQTQNAIRVCLGDGQVVDFERTRTITPPNSNVIVAEFEKNYTYAAAGIFQISFSDDNRSGGLLNLPNAEQTPMFIWTVINTHVSNSTPLLPYLSLNAGVRQEFTSDLKRAGSDTDSVSVKVYRVSRPSLGECGVRMPDHSYVFPNEVATAGTFKVETATQQLVWKAPVNVGYYLFALLVEEWRDGVRISESYREGMITVTDRPGPTVEIPEYVSAEFGGPITSVPNVKSPELSLAVEAYPVPTNDYVTVKALSKQRELIRLQLIDLQGRVLVERVTPTPQITVQERIDLRPFSSGVYIIRASNSRDAVTQKVVR